MPTFACTYKKLPLIKLPHKLALFHVNIKIPLSDKCGLLPFNIIYLLI